MVLLVDRMFCVGVLRVVCVLCDLRYMMHCATTHDIDNIMQRAGTQIQTEVSNHLIQREATPISPISHRGAGGGSVLVLQGQTTMLKCLPLD
jgi:hypothetical protein